MMSACGVMCSECPAYLAAARGLAHQRRTVEAWHRIYGLTETVENISCGGCLGADDELFHTSRRCEARLCCRRKGLDNCAQCPSEQCPHLERAQAAWDGVPSIAPVLSPADFARYARPYCGHRQRLAAARAERLAEP
jgi:Protein of unknown function (DUF3795)